MKAVVVMLLLAMTGTQSVVAQDSSVFKKALFIRGNDTLPYRILLPRNYDSTQHYPLVFFLHGAGERGRDNEKQLSIGSQLFVQGTVRRRYPAIVVFPQCPEDSYWSNVHINTDKKTGKRTFEFQPGGEPTKAMSLLTGLHQQLVNEFSVDSSQQYVMGLSMGGMGAFELVRRLPRVFAAAVPICGGADTSTAKVIRHTAFWIFHGLNDDVVPYKFSEDMVRTLQSFYNRSELQFTYYSGIGHNSWDKALAEPELLRWLFAQRQEKPTFNVRRIN